MRRLLTISTVTLLLAFSLSPSASAQTSLNLQFGGFILNGSQPNGGPVIDARDPNDVIAGDIKFLDFLMADFNGPTVNGELLFGIGNNIEAGLGIGYYSRTVPSVYADTVNDNGTEIEQDLKLRIVPFSATVRWLPLGQRATVVPYLGAGLGVFMWHYEEVGQFVDFRDQTIFSGQYEGSGSTTGPVILGGVRVPINKWSIGGEIRFQHAVGDLPTDQGFAGGTTAHGPTIDLGGFNYLFTVNVKF